ncbi:MAG: DUF4905 domain-containing protein [Ignavibacteriales bacterium]|nr:DUF4905 domain-containing protein [Ignavibacteriales bacterium]
MKINKKYSFTNNRQIWRILISSSNKLIIEDRDIVNKQAYFNCIDAYSGKVHFKNHQLEEKYWIGIEKIYKDVIFFHKYAKPDMPGHKVIIAFDINSQQILWQTEEYSYLFIEGDKVYTFIQKFEGRKFFALDYLTGKLVEELGNDASQLSKIRETTIDDNEYKNYLFPNPLNKESIENSLVKDEIKKLIGTSIVEGNIEHIFFKDLLLANYYSRNSTGSLDNNFFIINLDKQIILLDERINTNANAYVPDSFFIKDNLLFLLKEKTEVKVYSII